MIAVKCPICEGEGVIVVKGETVTAKALKTCHGCDGRGWVEVDGEQSDCQMQILNYQLSIAKAEMDKWSNLLEKYEGRTK